MLYILIKFKSENFKAMEKSRNICFNLCVYIIKCVGLWPFETRYQTKVVKWWIILVIILNNYGLQVTTYFFFIENFVL